MRKFCFSRSHRFLIGIALLCVMSISSLGGIVEVGASAISSESQRKDSDSAAISQRHKTYNDTDKEWKYAGRWSVNRARRAYQGQIHISNTIEDHATISIDGSRFTLIYSAASNYGKLDIFVDDLKIHTINQKKSKTSHQKEWTSPDLGPGTHVLKFVHASGKTVSIDAVRIRTAKPNPDPTPTGVSTLAETPTLVPSQFPNPTESPSPTTVPILTISPSPTGVVPVESPTSTLPPEATLSFTPTLPPSLTAGPTQTQVPSSTASLVPSLTASPTQTQPPPPTASFTAIASPTPINTFTSTSTAVPTSTLAQNPGGRIYYVATSGSDNNPGSQAQPLKTIQKAVSMVNAGDTIQVRTGTYNESVSISKSGSSGKEIKLMSYPGETAQLNGGSNMALYSKGAVGYWTIEGLNIKSTNQFAIRFGWFQEAITNHIILRNNYISGAVFTVGNYQLFEDNEMDGTGYTASGGYGGINDSYGRLGDNATHHNTYRHNYIHDFTNSNARGIWTQGRTHDNLIEGNRVENIWTSGLGQCIDLDAGQTNLVQWRHTVRNNSVKDCSYVGIQLENVFASLVENNLVQAEKGGKAGIIVINYTSKVGCGVGGENNQYGDTNGDNSCSGDLTHNVIQQNIIARKGAWSAGYGGLVNWRAGGLKIVGNTIYASGSSNNAAINFQASAAETSQAIIQNNILYNGNGAAICALSFDSFIQDSHNLLYKTNGDTVYGSGSGCSGAYSVAGYQTATKKGQNSIQADPQFIGPTDYNFHLMSTSPAVDRGANIGLSTDFDGKPRPQGPSYDIGAYELK